MIGSHHSGRTTNLNGRSMVEFYSALMGSSEESDKFEMGCLLSTLLKMMDNHNNRGIVNEKSRGDTDFIRPTYIIVEDLERETMRAKRLGATVIQEKTEVNGSGVFSLISDPAGGIVSLWQKIER